MNWLTCAHRFAPWFGPVLKCQHCGATTMVTMDRNESKPIYPPTAMLIYPLDRIVDKVLAYRVPARTKKAKKRQRKRRAQRVSCI